MATRTTLCTVFFGLVAATLAAQQTSTHFDAAVVVGDEFHRFEVLLDFDGDGYDDALDWWWTSTSYTAVKIVGWRNDHTGRMQPAWNFTLSLGGSHFTAPHDTQVGDFDGDGLDDFAVSFKGMVYLYASAGLNPPTLYATVDNGTWIDGIVLADFNQDGLDDLAVKEVQARLYLNRGPGQPMALSDTTPTVGSHTIHLCEVNGDGLPDLMTVRGTLVDFLPVANGQFGSPFSLNHQLGSSSDNHAVWGDIDGDGDEDGAVFQNGLYTVFRRVAPGAFDIEPLQAGGPATHLADITGDGILDGVCCGGGGDGKVRNTWPALFELAVNDGTGSFAPSYTIESLGAEHLAGAVDLDHDGDTDLVAGRVVYYARGALGTAQQLALSPAGFADRQVADFDGDGDPDLGFGVEPCLRNAGDGNFASFSAQVPDTPLPGGGPDNQRWHGPGYPGDFDGDGDVDLLVTWVSGAILSPVFQGMRLLENNGVGSLFDGGDASGGVNLNAGADSSTWDDPRAGLVADADGDGDLDLFTHRSATSATSWLHLNDGSGFFTPAGNWPTERVQAVVDLNGDAIPDLVSSDVVPVVRFGLGGGAFGAAVILPSTILDAGNDHIAVADLDGDGDVDVAAVDKSSRRLVVHWNDGLGGFTSATNLFSAYVTQSGATQRQVFATDVNDDGWIDLVVFPIQYASNASFVFLKRAGQSGWDAPIQQVFDATGFADVDGDGDRDALGTLLVANRTYGLPAAGLRRQYGAGKAGSAGQVPCLGAKGPFRVGETVEIRLTGTPAGAFGLFTVGLAESNLPHTPLQGSTAYNWPWMFTFLISTAGPSSPPGAGGLTLAFVPDAAVVAAGPLFHQVWFADAGASFSHSTTNGMELDYQP